MGDLTVRLTTRLARGETILFLAFLALTCGAPASVAAQGASQHRAGLVVRFGDGSVLTRCVAFREPSISGAELLMRAGLPVVIDLNSPIGAGVCKIGRDGCDRGKSCFCQCEGSACAYWQYFHLQSGAWKYSSLGAGAYQVADGAVEGWAWGSNIAPPTIPFDQICPAGGPVAAAPAPAQLSPSPTIMRPAQSAPTASATAAPFLTPVSTAAPTDTPARVSPSVTIPPTVLPTLPATPLLAPSQTLAPQVVASTARAETNSTLAPYAIFGVIVAGLGAWLIFQSRRTA